MFNLTTIEQNELQNIIRFAIDANHVNNDQELILESVYEKITNFDDSMKQIEIVWSIEDVQECRSDLTDEQAMQVLLQVKKHHDCTLGITWDTLNYQADEMFPKSMTHPDHCGKPCADCTTPCALDESTPCSLDCQG